MGARGRFAITPAAGGAPKGNEDQVRDLGASWRAVSARAMAGGRTGQADPNAPGAAPEVQSAANVPSEAECLATESEPRSGRIRASSWYERLIACRRRSGRASTMNSRSPCDLAQKFREVGPTTPLLRSAFQGVRRGEVARPRAKGHRRVCPGPRGLGRGHRVACGKRFESRRPVSPANIGSGRWILIQPVVSPWR